MTKSSTFADTFKRAGASWDTGMLGRWNGLRRAFLKISSRESRQTPAVNLDQRGRNIILQLVVAPR